MKRPLREPEVPPELRALRCAVPVEAHHDVDERRARLVARIGEAIAAAPAVRRRQRRRVALTSAAVAALAATALLAVATLSGPAHGPVAGRTPPPPAARPPHLAPSAPSAPSAHAPAAQVVRARALRSDTSLVQAGTTLPRGARLALPKGGWTALRLSEGVDAELTGRADLELLSLEPGAQRLRLRRGRVDVSVPHADHPSPRRFVVATPDAEVQVRGTVFSVEVDPSSARGVTQVFVARGSVAVLYRGQEFAVPQGERWVSAPSGSLGQPPAERDGPVPPTSLLPARSSSTPPAPSAQGSTAPAPTAQGSTAPGSTAQAPTAQGSTAQGSTAPAPTAQGSAAQAPSAHGSTVQEGAASPRVGLNASSLETQNRLFEDALAARRRGNLTGSLTRLNELLRRFPRSPLAPSVRLERTQVEQKLAAPSGSRPPE